MRMRGLRPLEPSSPGALIDGTARVEEGRPTGMHTPSDPPPAPAATEARWRFGPFELDSRTLELVRSGRPVRLAPKPAEVLVELVSHAGSIVRRDEFRERIWPEGGIDFDHALNTCIREVRRALRDPARAPIYIETLPRRGYRFRAPVEPVPAGDVATPGGPARGATAAGRVPSPGLVAVPTRRRRSAIRVACALGLLAVALAPVAGGRGPAGAGDTLLVLPFEDLGPEPDTTFFSEGLSEDVIGALASLEPARLRVIGRESSDRLSRMPGVVGSGAEVRADFALRGTVRRQGGRVRVVATLVRVADGVTLWARAFDRDPGGGLDVQSELAGRVAGALSVELAAGGEPRSPAGREAREAWSIGRHLLRQTDPEVQATSIGWLERAAMADPTYVPAVAYLAEARLWFGDRDAARADAERAVRLDPENAHGHYVLGQLELVVRRDLGAAERESRRAVSLSPGLAEYHVALAYVLSVQARHHEALDQMELAAALDPVAPSVSGDAGLIYYWARRYGDAAASCRRTLELEPSLATALRAHDCILVAELRRGHPVEAARSAEAWVRLAGVDPGAVGWSDRMAPSDRIRAFRRWRLQRVLRARRGGAPVSFQLACLYADLGATSEALGALEAAVDEPSLLFPSIAVEPRLDALRDDPRFTGLAGTMSTRR